MDIKSLYDKVNQSSAVSQNNFMLWVNECLTDINSKYGTKYVFEDGAYKEVTDVEQTLDIFDEWLPCIINYVEYKKGNTDSYTLYSNKTDYAYRMVWKKFIKSHRFKMHPKN